MSVSFLSAVHARADDVALNILDEPNPSTFTGRIIDLRKGHPKPCNLPHHHMAAACRLAAARLDEANEDVLPLQYSPTEYGTSRYLKTLANFLSKAYGGCSPVFEDWLLDHHWSEPRIGARSEQPDKAWRRLLDGEPIPTSSRIKSSWITIYPFAACRATSMAWMSTRLRAASPTPRSVRRPQCSTSCRHTATRRGDSLPRAARGSSRFGASVPLHRARRRSLPPARLDGW